MITLKDRWHHHGAVTVAAPSIGMPAPRAPARAPRAPRELAPKHLQVLRAISDGRVTRDLQYGDLAPWMLDGHGVGWSITVLAARGHIVLTNTGLGPPVLTVRGAAVLNGRD